MILVTTATAIEGCHIMAYKAVVTAATFEELHTNAESVGANAVLNTCYDNALDVDTLFDGAAVVIEPFPVVAPCVQERLAAVSASPSSSNETAEAS
ncbi:MAG: hypothetical protein ACRD19_12225 [Terriglobia bacterium]